jgi:hypothetical protein
MASLLSYALTSLSDVKESLGISSGDTSKDNLIIRKINQATRAIEAYCGRRFKLTTYTNQEYNATNTDELVLRQRPIVSVSDFGVRNTGLNDNNWESIESDLYFVDTTASFEENSGILKLMFTNRGSWNRFRVSYIAGYTTIPEDLAEACATVAAFYVKNADGTAFVQDMQEGQRRLRYSQGQKSFKMMLQELGIEQIIESYANYPLGSI